MFGVGIGGRRTELMMSFWQFGARRAVKEAELLVPGSLGRNWDTTMLRIRIEYLPLLNVGRIVL